MTTNSANKILASAKAVGISARLQPAGIQRQAVVINNKVYDSYNKAMDALTTQYLKKKGK